MCTSAVPERSSAGNWFELHEAAFEGSGLTTVFVSECRPQRTTYDRFYFMGVMRRGDPLPQWARPEGCSHDG